MKVTKKKKRVSLIALGLASTLLLTSALLNQNEPAQAQSSSTPTAAADDGKITMAFTGDMQFTGTVATQINKNGIAYPFAKVKPVLEKADIAMGNLETTLTTGGTAQSKQYTFRSSPAMAKSMANAGYDIVGLANNHSLDFGTASLLDTMKYLSAQHVTYAGGGKNAAEATAIRYIKKNGQTVAFLNYSRVLPSSSWFATSSKPGLASAYDTKLMYSKVKEARKKADIVVVFIHWGKERMTKPEAYQTSMGHTLIDLGADVVVGHHPHIMQPVEWYKGKLIAYSLGNFVFTKNGTDRSNQTAILQVTVQNKKIGASLVPARILNGQPLLMPEKEKAEFLRFMDTLSLKAKVTSSGSILP
ncbi:CapA family protein [Aneurinibacillus tyrosinisolvens]|uniref:CapA family protein n=1 Tax=Aneurinibacillus tyrosinisolvens TaxID=1443435 RepID=UPI000699CB28|nr:CapA family protein [Aneurinibacillus tyrosinisolvens]